MSKIGFFCYSLRCTFFAARKKEKLTFLIAKTEKSASTAPAAPSKWPTAPFVLLTLISSAFAFPSSPSMTDLIASFSTMSPKRVDVA